MSSLENCQLCPRKCGTNRAVGVGFCGAGNNVKIARAALHFWEEPCISGTLGSGTVFFSGCNLACVYCQNKKISTNRFGAEISVPRLAEIFLSLQAQGAHNINLVTPTPYVPQIIEAIDLVKGKIKIPFVYNTGGYESIETLSLLDNYIDIFLTDIKYFDSAISFKYSAASDYFEKAIMACEKMISITKNPVFDNSEMLTRGTIIRHLVLPQCRKDSMKILEQLSQRFSPDQFLLSIMSQYTPNKELLRFPELNRRITSFEYQSVVDKAISLGFENGYTQDFSSQKEEFIPLFDLSGV